MGRLIAGLVTVVGWICFATVLSLAIVAAYAYTHGYLAPEKVENMAAIAYGVEMIPRREAERLAKQRTDAEKPSLEAVELQRAAMTGDLELRENIIRDMVAEFKKLQRSLEEEKERFEVYAGAFRRDLQNERTEKIAQGQREFRTIIESMKPRQAKEQLLLKYKENMLDVVIDTMKNMEDGKRVKVLAEFKSPEEQDVLAKILERIRSPGEDAASRTLEQTGKPAQE